MGDGCKSAPDPELPVLSPDYDGAGNYGSNKKEDNSVDLESGPSRPPTPHGPGLPTNFAEVVKGIYRSSYPLPDHFESIQSLNLKTIITLVDQEYSRQFKKFVKENGINTHVIPILANKDAKVFTPQTTILEVLKILFNPETHPVLVHCNKGKHRTGCVIACFRRAQGWSTAAAVAEYVRYSTPKTRLLDRKYIESFEANILGEFVGHHGVQYWGREKKATQKQLCNAVDGDRNFLDEGEKTPTPKSILQEPPIYLTN
ncbi:tyrosine-protein phosphatase siw14 [Ophidiomyces ophidiicola]|nr:tyrosine-protein phosphatase siw14 [Ophidiomyces ophidiicola]KAI1986703.1 tyrosine-protein phosphatase siw14 [Ophidiomyces ophidiicola]KAI1987259.1 tyrosine-protein phosphatase siw14 [Ophidiomyces ophidiicola]KAI1988423.1 tyrosine-protein phosphatase siw14 [Ophidiomyces ophidiicola]